MYELVNTSVVLGMLISDDLSGGANGEFEWARTCRIRRTL